MANLWVGTTHGYYTFCQGRGRLIPQTRVRQMNTKLWSNWLWSEILSLECCEIISKINLESIRSVLKALIEKVTSAKHGPAHASFTYQPHPGGRCGWWSRTGSPLCTCSSLCPTAPRSPWWGSSAGYGPGGQNQRGWDLLKQSFTLSPPKRTVPWIISLV